MKQKNNSVSRGILFKSLLVALLLSVSITSWSQVITTIAGNGIPSTAAELGRPQGVAVDASGNVYIADIDYNVIRKVNTSGVFSTIAGNGYRDPATSYGGYSGDGGPATAAELNSPIDVAVDASGNVYIVDYRNDRIREVNTSGVISTIAGNGYNTGGTSGGGYSGDGGPATAAELHIPTGVAVDASGNVYIVDYDNQRIREVNTSGIITTFAGSSFGYSGDGGPATAAKLYYPWGIAVDASGNVYIADEYNDCIRKVNTSGIISTIAGGTGAGSLSGNFSGDGGPATAAGLYFPRGVAVDASGNVYIGDYSNQRIREVNTSGIINTFAGNGSQGYSGDGGPATAADLSDPTGVAVDASDNIYIADAGNNRVRKVTYTFIVLVSATPPSCIGESTGTASATPYDGTGPYTYSWSPGGQTDSTVTGLSAGTYTITLTENGGATATASVTITQPNVLSISTSVTNIVCNGGTTGSAKVTASNGTSPYTYSWSDGITTNATGSVLSAGTYTVTVTDICGGTATTSVTISQPITITASASEKKAPSCNGGSNGTATATASNGKSPYTYSWSPSGGTKSTGSNLSAGTYTVTVTDICGTSATASATITQPIAVTTSASVISNACNATSDGNAMANPSAGTSPYTYSWSNGITSNPTGPALSAGTYTVTVHDNCGNLATASVTITQPATHVTPTAFVGANVSCRGGSNGQAKVSVSGGKAPYAYFWNPSTNSTYIASGLSAGTYTVTVVDNNGCNASSSTTLTQPTLLKDSVSTVTYPQCGGETAGATIGVTGGTSPYRYTWSPNVSTTASATGLTIRGYVVQVKDVNGCYNDLSFSISQPPVPVLRDSIVKSATVNVSCNGSSNGSATVGVKYGTPSYTYSWSVGGGTNATINGLSVGTYSVTVNDAGGCTATASVSIGQSSSPLSSVTAFVAANVSCNGGSNGVAKVSVSGGSSPYTYSWLSPASGSTYIASGLSVGTYTVTVTDNCGTSASSSAEITQPAILSDSVITSSIVSPPCSGGGTGSAAIGVTGGTSPYRYTWSPNVSTTDSASGLTVRGYVVQVKDKNGCYNNITFNVTCSSAPATATYKGDGATCCPLSDNINLYPNPNTGQFTLSGLQQGMILEMYDYTGKMISAMTTTNESMQLNILNQADGVYLIRILDKDGNLVSEKKVVKTQ